MIYTLKIKVAELVGHRLVDGLFLLLVASGLALYFVDKHLGHGLVVGTAIIAILCALLGKPIHLLTRDRVVYIWPLVLFLFVLSLGIGSLVHGTESDLRRLHEAFEICLIGVFLFFIFSLKSPVFESHLPWLLALGAGITGVITLLAWEKVGFSRRMWQGTSMINISAGTQILLVGALLGFLIAQKLSWKSWMLGLAIALGSVSIFASGSRGAWLGLIAVVGVSGFLLVLRLRMSWKVTVPFVLVLAFGLVALLQTPQVQKRITHGQSDLHQYFSGGKRTTSLGLRLEMWRSAWDGFIEYPLNGMGAASLGKRWQGIEHDYHLVPSSPHVHNDFLEAAHSRGLLGLVSVMLVLLIPIYLGWRYRGSIYGKGLFTACSGFLVVGLFDTFLVMKFALFYYVVLVSVLLGLLYSEREQLKLSPAALAGE